MLSLESITWQYAGAARASLEDVSIDVRDGEVVGLVGASEAGKTTLCLVAGGLAPRVVRGRLEGRLLVDGGDVSGRPMHEMAALVGSAFQRPAAQISGVCGTVYEEVALGPRNLGLPRDEVIERAEMTLERMGLAGIADRDPTRLSGGQQQLVAICGLLAMRPRHLVLDDPTAELDPHGTRLVYEAIAAVASDGVAVLVAEHKTDELAQVCRRVVALEAGRVALAGPAADVLRDERLRELGVAEPGPVRLARLVAEAGLDPRVLESPVRRAGNGP